jgi:RNA polymerase sigma factor (sigma-70 family)
MTAHYHFTDEQRKNCKKWLKAIAKGNEDAAQALEEELHPWRETAKYHIVQNVLPRRYADHPRIEELDKAAWDHCIELVQSRRISGLAKFMHQFQMGLRQSLSRNIDKPKFRHMPTFSECEPQINPESEIDDKADEPSAHIALEELGEKINRILETLPAEECQIVKLRRGLADGKKYPWVDIAKIVDKSVSDVQQIDAKVIKKLRTLRYRNMLSEYVADPGNGHAPQGKNGRAYQDAIEETRAAGQQQRAAGK